MVTFSEQLLCRYFYFVFYNVFSRVYDDATRVLYSVPNLKTQEIRTDTLVSLESGLTLLEIVTGYNRTHGL